MNYGLKDRVAVVTGGGGAICGTIAAALAQEGVRVAIWDLSAESARKQSDLIVSHGGQAVALECNVLDKNSVADALARTLDTFQRVDILINGAGGSRKEATTSTDMPFFDLSTEAITDTVKLNYLSAVIPSQAVGRVFVKNESGVILNISSIAGLTPLTRAIGYSNGKAATNSFTQWLAVHMAKEYSPNIRVNAIAPGFMLTDQNRFLLVDAETGEMTERGRAIVGNVPAGRYGRPEEIVGAALWLVSDQAGFVTGVIVPVDGGFTAYGGV